jgi:hypothetical protein
MDEGSTTHAICQLAGPTGAPCHAPITATSDKLKQHLMTQVHGMNKLKSAAFWQARQDEAAALLAPSAALPGGQARLPFASVPRGAVTLAPLSAEQQENAARDLMLVIVDELRPVSLFEDDTVGVKAVADPRMSLKRFLLKYRPDLNVVSRRTLVTLRKREYGQLKNASIVRLKQLPCLYGTTDAWTSDANVAYRTFAVVGIDPELWEPVHLCLATRAVPRHTDIAVIQFYRDILSEFSIAAGKLLGIVADGNERSSVTGAGLCYRHCAAHVLNLVLEHAASAPEFAALIAEAKECVTKFRKLPLQHKLELVAEELGETVVKMKQQAWTRFSSLCDMVESLLLNKATYLAYCQKERVVDCVSAANWLVMSDVKCVCAPIRKLATDLSGRGTSVLVYYTNVLVLPGFYARLRPHLKTEIGREFLDSVSREFRRYVDQAWDVQRAALALAVAPGGFHYSAAWFDSCCFQAYPDGALAGLPRFPAGHVNAGKPNVEGFRLIMLEELKKAMLTAPTHLFGADDEEQVSSAAAITSYEEYLSSTQTRQTTSSRPVDGELNHYARESQGDTVSKVTDPLGYWKQHCKAYPRVAYVALDVLSEPASAIFPEQNWSAAAIISENRRSRLSAESMDETLFLYWNRKPTSGLSGAAQESLGTK